MSRVTDAMANDHKKDLLAAIEGRFGSITRLHPGANLSSSYTVVSGSICATRRYMTKEWRFMAFAKLTSMPLMVITRTFAFSLTENRHCSFRTEILRQ